MSTETTLAATAGILLLAPVVFLAATMAALTAAPTHTTPTQSAPSPMGVPRCTTTSPQVEVPGLSAEQIANAATIVAVGRTLGIPTQGQVVALMAAIAESGLRNLPHGDRDSLGLFQQRPSRGWGSPTDILNPNYAATQFYRHLLALPGWQTMTANNAAQAVQRSATPNAYAPHEPAAQALVTATHTGVNCADNSPGASPSTNQVPP